MGNPKSNPESRIYENEHTKEKQESLQKVENNNVNIKTLSNTIGKIENKLKNLGNGEDFFMKNMNDYLENKYKCKFEKDAGKGLILVFDKGQKDNIKDLADKLKIIDGKKGSSEVFIDENKDNKKDKNEIGVKLDNNKTLESDSIYLSKDEAKNKMVSFGKDSKEGKVLDKDYSKGGKLVYENNKVYYEVGAHGDHLAAVIRLFTAVSDEYFNGMNVTQINKKIKNLHYNKDTGEFKNFDDGKKVESGYKKVGDFSDGKWTSIVQSGAKIDITSLSEAVTGKEREKPVAKKTVETKETTDWGRFYESADGEVYDVPDNWKNITYKGYNEKYHNLNGSQISIGAKSVYDSNNENNNFSKKDEITLNGKKAFLLVGEGTLTKKINKTSEQSIKKSLGESGLEAWLIVPGEKGKVSITEVGDKRVQTVTETSDKVERGEDKDHSIVLSGTEYKFDGKYKGSIDFTGVFNKKDKKLNFSKATINGLTNENFNDVFPGGKGYLQLENHLVEVSLNKDKKISFNDLGEAESETLGGSGVSIFSESFSGLEFNKGTGNIRFPKLEGWGKIEGKLSKGKDTTKITLSDEYKIGGKSIDINLLGNTGNKLSPSDIQTKVIAGLLLLEKSKDELDSNNPNMGGNDDAIKINDKKIMININKKLPKINELMNDKNKGLFTHEGGENKDTYIFDKIKTDVEKVVGSEKIDKKP